MTFQAWKMVSLNSMTFQEEWSPCNGTVNATTINTTQVNTSPAQVPVSVVQHLVVLQELPQNQ